MVIEAAVIGILLLNITSSQDSISRNNNINFYLTDSHLIEENVLIILFAHGANNLFSECAI